MSVSVDRPPGAVRLSEELSGEQVSKSNTVWRKGETERVGEECNKMGNVSFYAGVHVHFLCLIADLFVSRVMMNLLRNCKMCNEIVQYLPEETSPQRSKQKHSSLRSKSWFCQ